MSSNGNGNGQHHDYTLLTEAKRRARKMYRCVHCTEHIEPGTGYFYTSGAYDGSVCGDHWHIECRNAVLSEFGENEQDWQGWEAGAYQRGTVQRYVTGNLVL